MKFLVVFVALFAVALAAVAQDAQTLRQESDVQPDGYNYVFETSDGTAAESTGHLINPGSENEALVVKGSFRYIGDDGVTYEVKYVADENGFQPQAAHLPVAPEA